MKLLRRLLYWRHAAEREQQLREEMESHRDQLRQELEAGGLSPAQARQEAARRFGSAAYHAEESRGTWLARALTDLHCDLRYASRLMRRSPGVTAVAVLSAALGIGVATAIFTVGNTLLERPLRVAEPERLIALSGRHLKSGHIGGSVSWPEGLALNETAQSMQGVAAYFPAVQGIVQGEGEPVRYWGSITSANYFDVVQPGFTAGGGFSSGDNQMGRPPVAVLSHALWQSRFPGDRGVVGRTIQLNGRAVTVVGVTAPGFRGTDAATISDFWIPMSMIGDLPMIPPTVLTDFSGNWLFLLGRLRPGHTVATATQEFDVLAAQLRAANKGGMPQRSYHLEVAGRLFPAVRGVVETIYYLLLATSLLVLLIACANIANLLLARAAARQKEIATRLAIGAGRGRLIRQLLTESLALAAAGGALGLALCWLALPLLNRLDLPLPIPIDLHMPVNARVLAFTSIATLLTGLVFGLVPAWKASRQNYIEAIKGGAHRRWNLRDSLVVAQVAVAVVLLVAAGLLLRSLQAGAQLDAGIGARNLLMVAVDPGLQGYTQARANRFLDEVTRRVAALPGVEQVSTTSRLPVSMIGINFSAKDARRTDPGAERSLNAYGIGPGFFATIQVPVLSGEEFAPRHEKGDAVALLNETAARELFGSESPLGRMLGGLDRPYRIAGVVADFKSATLGESPSAALFILRSQLDTSPAMFGTYLVIRTVGEPGPYLGRVRQEIHALDSGMAILDSRTWSHHRQQALLMPRLAAGLVTFCGAMGFLIAAIGLYGVIRYAVERRTRELGIRLALGATAGQIQGLVLRHGAWLTGIGLALGLALAAAMGRTLQGMLYGIGGTDALTFALVIPLVTLVALVAAWLPARKAARMNPVATLRQE